mgnify:CR=1 FL=1
MIKIFVGYDPRESIAYHTFCQSVLSHASEPVAFAPLAQKLVSVQGQRDGTNDFIYSRFLVPYLCDFSGWAIFADGDMLALDDIAKLWAMRDESKVVMVCKHDYQTKYSEKYLGTKNESYPRKNWSSVVLWNCAHPLNLRLTPTYIDAHPGSHLHRFAWIPDQDIGGIPFEWNWLVSEYQYNPFAKLVHYTIGGPYFTEYAECDYSKEWFNEFGKVGHCLQRN